MEPQKAVLVLRDGREIEAEFNLYLEARLALAPVIRDGAPGPMIEFRRRLVADSETDDAILFDNRYYGGADSADRISSAVMGGSEFEIATFPSLDLPEAEHRHGQSVYAWEEVNPARLSSLFGDFALTFEVTPQATADSFERLPASRFRAGTAAFTLHARLLGGELEAELAAACRDCADRVERFRLEAEERVLESEARAEARWVRDVEE